jgi:hypothetical protein
MKTWYQNQAEQDSEEGFRKLCKRVAVMFVVLVAVLWVLN